MTATLELPQSIKEFIETEAAAAGFATPAEFVCQLVRQAQRQKAIDFLMDMVEKSIASGEATEVTPQDFEELRRSLGERYGNTQKSTP